MVNKKNSKKENEKTELKPKKTKEEMEKTFPTLKLANDKDIALDFANKVYQKIGKVIKSIILFGSAAKGITTPKSDIDIIIVIDDATIQWDSELIAWYREELGKIINKNPYIKPLHINTVRLTTWWSEMMRGEPVILNIIRWGVPLIDFGGFFNPLKSLMIQGKIKGTPEMIYITLGRAPAHLLRAKTSMLNSLEAIYWAFVDSSHSALIAAKQSPPSPEHIPAAMREFLVDKGLLKEKYVDWYRELYSLTHKILRGEITDIKGEEIQLWRERADEYLREMAIVVKKITGFMPK
ncbi:MAG: nucleotidyltransferase domain-containing protein [Candidatus Pacearchaeota archaeon]